MSHGGGSLSTHEIPKARVEWVDDRADEAARIREFVAQLSRFMDSAFELPLVGWRFGWDAVIGLVPAVGDAATMLVSVYIIALAARVGVPRITLARMGLNVALDMLVGAIPFVGDLFDVFWKANLKNAALLDARLKAEPRSNRKAQVGDWLFVAAVLVALVALLAGIVTLIALAFAGLFHFVFG